MTAEQERLVVENMRLVPFLVNKYYSEAARFLEFDDLVAVGNVGLVRAALFYDGSTKFSTFAGVCVSTEVSRFITENRSMLHIPREKARTMTPDQLSEYNVQSVDALGFNDTADIRAFRDINADFEDFIVAKIDIERALKLATEKQREAVKLKMQGKTAAQASS